MNCDGSSTKSRGTLVPDRLRVALRREAARAARGRTRGTASRRRRG
ncbi:MAG: hypothetical protein MZV63_18225 [Marinilabiliales bacterium]|nr:hypothetical protein [Marinilabiliales bacterium]